MNENTVTMIIDGREIQANADQTIMQAADDAGIYIPRLCYHNDLEPGGHCRICTVKINGRAASACTFPVADGLVIETDTDELNEARRKVVEMLFVEGNHFCPFCEKSGNCELQALAYRLGVMAPTYPYLYQQKPVDASHKDVYIDRDRCIICGRCVRSSRDLDKKVVFGFEGRGINKRIAIDTEYNLAATVLEAADKAIEMCPTGSIMIKRKGYEMPYGTRLYDKEPIGSDIEKNKVKI